MSWLTALPDLLKLLFLFIGWVKDQEGVSPQVLIKDVGEAFVTLKGAESHEERQNAAKDLASVISRLP